MKYLILLILLVSCRPNITYNYKLELTYYDGKKEIIYYTGCANVTNGKPALNQQGCLIQDHSPCYKLIACGVRRFEVLKQDRIK